MIEELLEDYAKVQVNLSSYSARNQIANSIIDLFSGKRKKENVKQLRLKFGEFEVKNRVEH